MERVYSYNRMGLLAKKSHHSLYQHLFYLVSVRTEHTAKPRWVTDRQNVTSCDHWNVTRHTTCTLGSSSYRWQVHVTTPQCCTFHSLREQHFNILAQHGLVFHHGEVNFTRHMPSVAQWPSGWDARLAINRLRVRIPVSPLSSATLGKLLTHTCLFSPSSIIWYQPMGGDALRLGR